MKVKLDSAERRLLDGHLERVRDKVNGSDAFAAHLKAISQQLGECDADYLIALGAWLLDTLDANGFPKMYVLSLWLFHTIANDMASERFEA